jgi:hypothetical protein
MFIIKEIEYDARSAAGSSECALERGNRWAGVLKWSLSGEVKHG